MNKIVIMRVDDWMAIYVNGIAMDQGHTIEIGELTSYCPIESIEERWVDDNVVAKTGHFPKTLEEANKIDGASSQISSNEINGPGGYNDRGAR